MKASLLLLACLTALFTSIAEPPELFLSKLEARLSILGQMIVTWEEGLMESHLHPFGSDLLPLEHEHLRP